MQQKIFIAYYLWFRVYSLVIFNWHKDASSIFVVIRAFVTHPCLNKLFRDFSTFTFEGALLAKHPKP